MCFHSSVIEILFLLSYERVCCYVNAYVPCGSFIGPLVRKWCWLVRYFLWQVGGCEHYDLTGCRTKPTYLLQKKTY